MAKLKLLAGAAAGAGILSYLRDSDRRARLADQATAAARGAVEAANGKLDMLRDATLGAAAEALPDEAPANDPTLIAKVRSEALGARFSTVDVEACDGVVTLRGQLDSAEEIDEVADAVAGVAGVEDVENLVHLPGETPRNTREARRASTSRR